MGVSQYFEKYAGGGAAGTPMPSWSHTAYSFLFSFVGMALIGLVHTYVVGPVMHLQLLVAAFGAMSVLLFSAIKAPVSQPFNTICGNTIGAIVGVSVVSLLETIGYDGYFWLSGALSVSLTIVAQEQTGTVHPPGGATALIFALVVPFHAQYYSFVFSPALLGAVIMVGVSVAMNNLVPERTYPQFWSPVKREEEKQVPMVVMDKESSADETGSICTTEDRPSCAGAYFAKFAGAGGEAGPRPKLTESFFSFLGAFSGMSVLGLLSHYVLGPLFHLKVEVAAFGAMSVLIFSTCKAPLAQPSNAIIGNTIGGAVGVAVVWSMQALGLGDLIWTSGALSVSLTIAVQERTNSVHPPGGATALLYALTPALQTMGLHFIYAPAFLGAVILVVVGTLTNNLSPERTYPQRWTFDDSKRQPADE